MLYWIIVGILAGWLTGQVMHGRGYGLVGDLIVGLLGGVIGGWLFDQLGIRAGGTVGSIVVAFVGGVVLVVVLRSLRRL